MGLPVSSLPGPIKILIVILDRDGVDWIQYTLNCQMLGTNREGCYFSWLISRLYKASWLLLKTEDWAVNGSDPARLFLVFGKLYHNICYQPRVDLLIKDRIFV